MQRNYEGNPSYGAWDEFVEWYKAKPLYVIIYVLIVIAFFVSIAPFFSAYRSRFNIANEIVGDRTVMSVEELESQCNSFQESIKDDPKEEPSKYYQALIQARKLRMQATLRSDLSYYNDSDKRSRADRVNMMLHQTIMNLNNAYVSKFGFNAMSEIGKQFRDELDRIEREHRKGAPWNQVSAGGWKQAYINSLLFIGLFLLVRVKSVGQKLMLVPFELHKFIPAVIGWPIGVFLYPKNNSDQLRSALRFCALMLVSVLSVAVPNAVKAAEGKKNDTTKDKRGRNTLYLEGRAFEPLDTDGKREQLIRWKFETPKKWFCESLHIVKPNDAWVNDTYFGKSFTRGKLTVNPVIGAVVNQTAKSRTLSATAGVQLFGKQGEWSSITPALRLERQADTKQVTFLAVSKLFRKFTNCFSAGAEASVKITEMKPAKHAIGPLIRFNIRGQTLEVVALRDQDRVWRARVGWVFKPISF